MNGDVSRGVATIGNKLPIAPIPDREDPVEREGRAIALHAFTALATGGVLWRAAAQSGLRRPWLNLPTALVAAAAGSAAATIADRIVEDLTRLAGRPQPGAGLRFWVRYSATFWADAVVFAALSWRLEGLSLWRGTSRWAWAVGWPLAALMLAANAIDRQAAGRIVAARLNLVDPRTQLRNHTALEADLNTVLSAHVAFSCVYIDLDGFKGVNDSLGHPTGDAVLRVFAAALCAPGRFVYRIGGDEFVVLIPDTEYAPVERQAREIFAAIRMIGQGYGRTMGASFGVATVQAGSGRSTGQIQSAADAALLRGREVGRGHLSFESGPAINLRPDQ